VETRHDPEDPHQQTSQSNERTNLSDWDPQRIPSPVLARLIDEIRNEETPTIEGYSRYDRFHNRHNR
jgi:hypothetical protein